MWRKTRRYLWSTLKRHRRDVVVVAAGGVLAGGVATSKSFLESALIQEVADAMANRDGSEFWSRPLQRLTADEDADWALDLTTRLMPEPTVVTAVLVYVALTLLGALVVGVTTLSRQRAATTLFASLYADGLARAFHDGMSRREVNEPGGLAGAIQQGASSVSSAYAFLIEAVQYLFALATVVIVLLSVDLQLVILCVVITAVMAMISWLRGRHLERRRNTYDEQRRKLFARADDVLSNRDVLVAHERQDHYVALLRDGAGRLATVDKELAVREQSYSSAVNLIYDMGRLLILGGVLYLALHGSPVERVGDAYFYVSLFARLFSPVQNLLRGYDSVRRSASLSSTLMTLLDRRDLTEHPQDATSGQTGAVTGNAPAPAPNGHDAVRFSDVTFGYGSGPVLERCSFSVPTGGVTLVVGRSGSGKTTASRLVLGFLQPQSGSVEVFGRDTRDWNHRELLAQLSYLAQTGHVVEGTVEENLFADDSVTQGEMEQALATAGLDPTNGDGRPLLEVEAKTCSEGQQQRLALARILVDRSPIAILDEPLAGVDVFTFGEVRAAMTDWLQAPGRTTILVSHRLAFASVATHVVVLGERGAVAEQGSPRDLLARPDSVYRRLVETAQMEAGLRA